MKWGLYVGLALSLAVAAHAADKKAAAKGGEKTVALSPLLPAGEHPTGVLILQKNDQGVLAPVLLGKQGTTTVEENGQQVEKPDPLAPGTILIIRDIDEATSKGLQVTNGTTQVGGAYIARQNHALEYLGQVDLTQENKQLAKSFGVHGVMVLKKK